MFIQYFSGIKIILDVTAQLTGSIPNKHISIIWLQYVQIRKRFVFQFEGLRCIVQVLVITLFLLICSFSLIQTI